MTTTASKHGLRAAATERRTKHAQRTPLPPRAGEVEEARQLGVGRPTARERRAANRDANVAELAVEQPEIVKYGSMTVAQLKVEAKALGLVTHTLRTKGALLSAILERQNTEAAAKRALAAEARIDAQMAQENAEAEPAEAIVVIDNFSQLQAEALGATTEEEPLPSPSGRKATAFADVAEKLGWKATLQDSQTMVDIVKCIATRNYGSPNAEVITIEWEDGVFNNQTCFHTTPSGRQLKLRNASHAKKRMALAPADVVREDTKVGIHTSTRAERRSAASGSDSAPHAPHFSDDTPDAEVIASVTGKTITWVNGLSGTLKTDKVSAGNPPVIDNKGSGRTLSFLGSAGFRTVRISSIVGL